MESGFMEQAVRAGSATVLAAGAVLAGMAIFGLVDNFIPLITDDIGLWQFHALRSAIALPLLIAIGVLAGLRLAVQSWRAVILRSLLTGSAMVVYFGCLAFLPIGQVAAGLFTAPVFVILISAVLGERFGPWRSGAVALGFLGILLVLQPNGSTMGLLSLVPMIGGALYGAGAVATRRLCAGEATLTLLAGFFTVLGLWGVIGLVIFHGQSAGWVLSGWHGLPGGMVWAVIGVQAVGSLIAVGLVIWGYQTGDAAMASVCEYSLLVFAAVWAFVLRGETVNGLAMVGMACIIAAGLVITLRTEKAA